MAWVEIPLSNTICKAIVDEVDRDLSVMYWHVHENDKGYKSVRSSRHHYYLGRIVLQRKLGRLIKKGECVNYVDDNPFNNRRDNIRMFTIKQSRQNNRKQSNNTSGYKGVSWHRRERRWRSEIYVNHRNIHLGYFDDPYDAHLAYCKAADKYFGEFACYG